MAQAQVANGDAAIAALAEQIRAAGADGRKLRIAGHGSKAGYGEPFAPSGLDVLDMRANAGIVT
ncbi:hypothetical protein [Tepidiforma sp.]|uniref:hypothetical protein n=1 Tax=Tepidiforma sp. TaxID=2682230 RepID=UPI00262E8545|nr:hypothetical protein [Tepidiforma sp.]MCX7619194.1 hypothetical protein [Tepidiforma sp.]